MHIPKKFISSLPGSHWLKSLVWRFQIRYCRGVYDSFQAALAAIPSRRRVGFDNPESSRLYLSFPNTARTTDYAIFHWLQPLLAKHHSIFDFGGNFGRSYFTYEKYLDFPSDMKWLICDLPAVVETGRIVATQRQAKHLEFTSDFNRVEGFDILFTSGTLQFVEKDLWTLLAPLSKKPCHVLINRVPMSDRPTWFTVHDQGAACCAYRIANESEFVRSMRQLGYSLIDSWSCPESSCRILFYPSRGLDHYKGMYFRLSEIQ